MKFIFKVERSFQTNLKEDLVSTLVPKTTQSPRSETRQGRKQPALANRDRNGWACGGCGIKRNGSVVFRWGRGCGRNA